MELTETVPLSDKEGTLYRVEISDFGNVWIFRLFHGRISVGRANCVVTKQAVLIGDINISSEARVPLGFFARQISWAFNVKPRIRNYQKRQLGTQLLQLIINRARTRKFSSITGTFVQTDRERNPKLIEWYKKIGFEIKGQTILMRLQ